MAALESMLEDAELHRKRIALDKSRVDRSVPFIEELGCDAMYRVLQGCLLGSSEVAVYDPNGRRETLI